MKFVYKTNILIFAGGKYPKKDDLLFFLKNMNIELDSLFVIAADSGFEVATEFGFNVNLLLGDMDSISKSIYSKIDKSICKNFSTDKDFSDTELAFIESKKIPHDKVILVGASGGRIEHFIALLFNFVFQKYISSVMNLPDFWLTEENLIIYCKKNQKIKIQGLTQQDNVSLFSIGKKNFNDKIISKGLKWNLDKVNWKKQVSLSNRILPNTNFVELFIKKGCFLLILPLKDNISLV